LSRVEFILSAVLLNLVAAVARWLPFRAERVVLASARGARLEGSLAFLHRRISGDRPGRPIVLLLEPYAYSLLGKLAYLVRLIRGTYYLQTSGLVVIDNAYLPVHAAPHRAATTVVQVWHAAGALKRFGCDAPLDAPERWFLHRNYDYVVTSGEGAREPWSKALRTPLERVLPIGTPRTDLFHEPEEMRRRAEGVLQALPALRGRRVVLYAPTFRGRGRGRDALGSIDAAAVRAALPPEFALVLRTHPNVSAGAIPAAYDAVIGPDIEMNDALLVSDVLVSDYSSAVFEFLLLGRPVVLLVDDLEAYAASPGLYLDYPTEMVRPQVRDSAGVAAAILAAEVDSARAGTLVERYLGGCDGGASARFVERFLPA
jgi:CDP-glycerol glycerophosphotransferase (TagB/SpsB family)